jgi:hypothetical protein
VGILFSVGVTVRGNPLFCAVFILALPARKRADVPTPAGASGRGGDRPIGLQRPYHAFDFSEILTVQPDCQFR